MSKYTVTLQLADREQFMNFIDNVGPVAGQLVVTVAADEHPTEVAPKVRPTRVSKVNETILAALHNSTLTVKQLKEALEHEGLSAGSLSTGIAALTKDGQIERIGEGLYALAGYKQAAE
jgi:hypothetical protein